MSTTSTRMLKMKEYSIPNSRWLQRLLDFQIEEVWRVVVADEEWQKDNKDEAEYIQERKIDLEISTKILEQCIKTGKDKPVLLTEMQWDWMYKFLNNVRDGRLLPQRCLDSEGVYSSRRMSEE